MSTSPAPRARSASQASPDAAPRDRPRLTVDLDALARNYARLRAASAPAEAAAVVKADAYGLGAAPVITRLAAEGCRTFFVANLDEGAAVRAAAPAASVYVMGGLMAGDEARCAAARIAPVLCAPEQVERWAAARRSLPGAPAAGLFLDTGMNRQGLADAEARAVAERGALQADDVDLLVSHFACASSPRDPMNAGQLARFEALLPVLRTRFPGARASMANSAGTLMASRGGPDARYDLTRPGIALYGGAPFDDGSGALEAVATLEAPVLQVRALAPGDRVGYGGDHVVDRPTLAATVALGYADGFLRAGGGRGYGVIGGRRAPIIGRISMDLITLDVTAAGDAAHPGAFVEFLGPSALLDEQAEAAGAANYELLVRLGARCERRHVGGVGKIAAAAGGAAA